MKLRFSNLGKSPVPLSYDRHGPMAGISLEPSARAIVTVARADTDEVPINIDLLDGKVIVGESATVEQVPVSESATPTWPYDKTGRLADPAEWQQQVMLGFHDLGVDLGEAGFPPEMIAEFNALRIRFVEEFERMFPGYGKGRAIWR